MSDTPTTIEGKLYAAVEAAIQGGTAGSYTVHRDSEYMSAPAPAGDLVPAIFVRIGDILPFSGCRSVYTVSVDIQVADAVSAGYLDRLDATYRIVNQRICGLRGTTASGVCYAGIVPDSNEAAAVILKDKGDQIGARDFSYTFYIQI